MKKLLVISDTHGAAGALALILEKEKDADAIIYLGDGASDLYVLPKICPLMPLYVVRGNCDFASMMPVDGLVAFEGVLFYYCHSHLYNTKYGYDELAQAVRDRGADVGLFGHTHRAIVKNYGDITLFNPGSAGKSYAGTDSYGVITVDKEKGIKYEHRQVPEE